MTAPLSDNDALMRLRFAAAELQVQASLASARADDDDLRDYLERFADTLGDAMSDCLWPAQLALERNDRLRDTDPKARRKFMPVEPATGGGAP